MAAKKQFSDMELAVLLADGRTHQACADELGVSRVAVSNRVKKLKETNPFMLEGTTVDKFRSVESDQVAKARQYILNAVMSRVQSAKGLNRESLPQLIKSFAILWDKDERIQEKLSIKKVAVLHKHELDAESKQMLDELIEHRTNMAIREASPEVITVSGESVDETPEAPTNLLPAITNSSKK
jgi:DNA-binding Lrp family transcriptional regulator